MNKQLKKIHRVKIKASEINLILDHLVKGMTEAKFERNRKRAEAVHETYQTIGQALGEKNIILEFEES